MKVQLKGQELFSTGTWNGQSFNAADLDAIVNSFIALSLEGRVPLKLTHDGPDPRDDLESRFALGWVRRVWRDENRLLGDLEVPEKVAKAIDDGYLKFVSVELLRNVRADTRTIPWVLDAVALLGADQPAVGILKELRALMSKRSVTAMQCERRVAFSRDNHSNGDRTTMTDAERIAKLESDLAAARKTADDQRAEFDRKETERVKAEGAKRKTKAGEMFDAAIKAERIVPAVKERFMRNQAPRDESRWAEFDLADVEACIDENLKPGAKKFGRQDGKGGNADVDVELEGKSDDKKLTILTHRFCAEHNMDPSKPADLDRATVAVFRANPKLAEAYRNFACGIADDAA